MDRTNSATRCSEGAKCCLFGCNPVFGLTTLFNHYLSYFFRDRTQRLCSPSVQMCKAYVHESSPAFPKRQHKFGEASNATPWMNSRDTVNGSWPLQKKFSCILAWTQLCFSRNSGNAYFTWDFTIVSVCVLQGGGGLPHSCNFLSQGHFRLPMRYSFLFHFFCRRKMDLIVRPMMENYVGILSSFVGCFVIQFGSAAVTRKAVPKTWEHLEKVLKCCMGSPWGHYAL